MSNSLCTSRPKVNSHNGAPVVIWSANAAADHIPFFDQSGIYGHSFCTCRFKGTGKQHRHKADEYRRQQSSSYFSHHLLLLRPECPDRRTHVYAYKINIAHNQEDVVEKPEKQVWTGHEQDMNRRNKGQCPIDKSAETSDNTKEGLFI